MRNLPAILVLILAINAWSQDKPQAQLVDEFGPQQCDEFLARVDNLMIQLGTNPSANALVVFGPKFGSAEKINRFRHLIEMEFKRSTFSANRLRITQTKDSTAPGGKFWLLPDGATVPVVDPVKWPDETIDISRPFLFGTEQMDDVCPTFYLDDFAEFLRSHSNLHGKIVIHAYLQRATTEDAVKWLSDLEKLRVPRKRLRVFLAKPSNWERVDFWIVPRRNSRKKH